jgi:glyoxylase-like metal-dependent hydrolase (beta-lactamase superfamily II)
VKGEIVKIAEGLHSFIWNSPAANNCNIYLIDGPVRVLVDPGHLRLFGHVEDGLQRLGLGLSDIDLVIATHAHPDHSEAVKLFKAQSVPFAMHEQDWRALADLGRVLGVTMNNEDYTPDFFLQEGDLEFKGLRFQVIHTPGHSLGSISLFWAEISALLTGDVLFKDGLGRTDLPGGNGQTLKESITRLSTLNAELMCPGHGPVVSGKDDVRMNFSKVEQFWFAYI